MDFYSLCIATLLGIIEGLTEFIPVSSTGHLIVVGHFLGFTGESEKTFQIFIQLGAVLAVTSVFRERLVRIIPPRQLQGLTEWFAFENLGYQNGFVGLRGALLIVVGCAPAFILGFLFREFIRSALFGPAPVAVALIFGGILFLLLDRSRTAPNLNLADPQSEAPQPLDHLTFKQALIIGLFQCMALWPGMSRSGSSIIGGLVQGLHRKTAAEFSFLLALPLMLVATVYDLYKSMAHLSTSDIPTFFVGFISAFLVGQLAIKFFLSLLGKITLRPFGIYRIALGLLVIILLISNH